MIIGWTGCPPILAGLAIVDSFPLLPLKGGIESDLGESFAVPNPQKVGSSTWLFVSEPDRFGGRLEKYLSKEQY